MPRAIVLLVLAACVPEPTPEAPADEASLREAGSCRLCGPVRPVLELDPSRTGARRPFSRLTGGQEGEPVVDPGNAGAGEPAPPPDFTDDGQAPGLEDTYDTGDTDAP